MGANPKKMPPWANTSHPNGCSELAMSLDPQSLYCAAATGNRATRREAIRNLVKQARTWAKTPEGIRAKVDKAVKP